MKRIPSILLLLSLLSSPLIAGVRGHLALESRHFIDPADFGQGDNQLSLKIEQEFFVEGDASLFTLQFMGRKDSMDDERTHADIRELSWLVYGDDWEFRAGISKVFWGVAESQHLVDIINQTDAVENIDTEDKLGQPMLSMTFLRDWGNIDVFLLPYFRERTFTGPDGRFRASLPIDTDFTTYADEDGQSRLDGAIRWSATIGDWDIGLAHFSGTSRAPRFLPVMVENQLILAPHYTTIDQTSLDMQATLESWLWKLEMISNSGYDVGRYNAAVLGFEYSFYDVAESGMDIGVIMEYQYDQRSRDYAGLEVYDSLVIGSRLAWNDEQSTELLVGVGLSDSNSIFWNIEASRRLGQNWKVTLEGRILTGFDDNPQSPLFAVRNDSFVMLELAYFY